MSQRPNVIPLRDPIHTRLPSVEMAIRIAGSKPKETSSSPAAVSRTIGLEANHEGVVDLVTMKAYYFDGENGEKIREEEIPQELRGEAETKREEMLDTISMFSDELMESILEGTVTEEQVHDAIHKGVVELKLCPVLLGSAWQRCKVHLARNILATVNHAHKDMVAATIRDGRVIWPPSEVIVSARFLPLIMFWLSSGLIQWSWWSPWGVRITLQDSPPSMDFRNGTFST